jgi:hypothetical protein
MDQMEMKKQQYYQNILVDHFSDYLIKISAAEEIPGF